MLDHFCIPVSDIERSRRFYEQALAPLGYCRIKTRPSAISFGIADGYGQSTDPGGDFWIFQGDVSSRPATHFAFSAESRAHVDAFFIAAIAAGGEDNGRPGLRPNYHPDYYAAFVRDPDGYNLEAVCHRVA
ncbi:VOC family protein [Brenneria populi]|uniref:VOC family protein n=1 Tax=Brenneria populi TaxID=1505588 RepID=A0ABU6JQV8_9GAMM|nr:VOC family protein [Brenneria populi Li et al. 2015]